VKKTCLLILLASGSALADDAGLQRCREITHPIQRLQCYDALPIEAPRPSATPAAPAMAPRVPAGPAANPPVQFGFEGRASKVELASIASRIPGRFEGWGPNSLIKLENGQVWQISDGSSRFFVWNNPKVTIRRGALGSFFLDIEGDNRSPRVRRVQ
jgi:hypothetical protein